MTLNNIFFQTDSYYSHALCTPDGYYRKYYCSYPAGTPIHDHEPAEVVAQLDRVGELELDFSNFSSASISCLICKSISSFKISFQKLNISNYAKKNAFFPTSILLQALCCTCTTSSEVSNCSDSTDQLVARLFPNRLIAMISLKLLPTMKLIAVVTLKLIPIISVRFHVMLVVLI